MKVMFIVYEDIKIEARTQEILQCSKLLGNQTYFVSYSAPFDKKDIKFICTGKGKRNYFAFVKDSINAIKKKNPDIVVLHDNYTSIILKWLYKNRKNAYIIYDSSELYIDGKIKTFKQLVARHMRYFEKKYLKYADTVIAANEERAKIMKDYFKLKELPIIFDNIHKINDKFNEEKCEEKYGYLFRENTFNIVYAGGISKDRMTFELVHAVGRLGNNYKLIILGQKNKQDEKDFNLLLKEKGYSNVFYLGFIPRSDWRFILSKSHISVSIFAQNTVNNIYCASGKVYESLFEEKPILVSTNPPLWRLCKRHNVGISTDNFIEGILNIEKNYDFYTHNVKRYVKTLNYDKRIDNLAQKLKQRIG